MTRPTQASLDLAALRHNIGVARGLAPHSRLMAVVKANAYGHGARVIAAQLAPLVDALAVACIEEAVTLRDAGTQAPILLLQGVFEPAELPLATELGLWLTIANEQQLAWLEEARLPNPPPCWLKLDTGMHRLGVTPAEVQTLHRRLCATSQSPEQTVIYTHFAAADELGSDQTGGQIALFEKLTAGLSAPRSAANSAGLLAWPAAHYDWVRPGYMLYGNSPLDGPHPSAHGLRPVMTLRSAVTALREVEAGASVGYGAAWRATAPARIATVPVGYGDGYPRHAPNGTPVLVDGRRAPLAGRVSMDMITVDVTHLPGIELGAEVVLWGRGLPVDEVARHAGTIGYELTTRMPDRPPRIVVTP
ncbi:MAG: alanine racemase [Pseudomonadales bacterium]|nr:alanine racemase [Halieaceae bacterium]MCP5165416.1 alanine racemase [Pseudomonadales bacterium]MCP5190758.1 alanine racemase [Pseudomonadales bacterium]MCP5205123.1 alanine racemase [Pseudomonadales bacterium]